jgi:uncharacterized FAD-dependent dehydrogenase
VEMGQVFPGFNPDIREGFTEFGKSMHGYLTNEAILHAPESRTSRLYEFQGIQLVSMSK